VYGECPGYKLYTDAGINPCDVNGDPVLLDQMLAGLNLNPTVTGFGNVGTVTSTIYQSGAAHLRRSSTFQTNLANGDLNAAANSLLGLIPTGLQTLPNDPTGAQYFGTPNHPTPSLRTLRNGCDRIANGASFIQQNISGTATNPTVAFNAGFNASNSTPLRCFAEDYLITNSQFSGITYHANWSYNYYHSVQGQLTARPIQGVSAQSTLVWAKSMGLQGTLIDPSNRELNYGAQPSSALTLRMNGNVELPFGPNKLLSETVPAGWHAPSNAGRPALYITRPAQPDLRDSGGFASLWESRMDHRQSNWVLPKGDLQWSGNPETFTATHSPALRIRSVRIRHR
jgi:hypothetical protein